MAETGDAAALAEEPPAWTARRLLRAARTGTLATSVEGQPFASLVTPATAPDLSVLLLLSDLSEHTRHLRADPRCAVMVVGSPADANPQTAARLTVTGLAATVDDDGALKARWLAAHPYAAFYADFGDFHLWRIEARAALFVGGFARAFRLRLADLTPDPAAVAALAAAAGDIVAHCNREHPDTLALLARQAGEADGAWRMTGVDVDGCDLLLDDRSTRISWRASLTEADAVRAELIKLARAARASLG